MADVRAMLRAERAARAPPPKARKPAAPAPAAASKKRKADEDDDEDADTRKRVRAYEAGANVPSGFFDERDDDAESEEPQAPIPGFVPAREDDPSVIAGQELHDKNAQSSSKQLSATDGNSVKAELAAQPVPDDVDEAEWAAFQQFASSVPSKSALDTLKSNATLEAAPLSVEEAAAQAREEQNLQRSKRDEEIEDEKEEAAERLEEEFEVMEDLEDRIRRLKEKREILRRASKAEADAERPSLAVTAHPEAVLEESEDDDDSDEDADEFDGWRFGGS